MENIITLGDKYKQGFQGLVSDGRGITGEFICELRNQPKRRNF